LYFREAPMTGVTFWVSGVRVMNKFLKDESGATAIEYGLIAAAMAVCLLVAMPYITTALSTKFSRIGSSIKV
jgi:pilus assembly protein Flp/PilA